MYANDIAVTVLANNIKKLKIGLKSSEKDTM